ncbi:MAG: hypothetical protein HPY81_10090 [Firmicutes bacterium]|nr:hypothetical protein [Bacillota bacterium]
MLEKVKAFFRGLLARVRAFFAGLQASEPAKTVVKTAAVAAGVVAGVVVFRLAAPVILLLGYSAAVLVLALVLGAAMAFCLFGGGYAALKLVERL